MHVEHLIVFEVHGACALQEKPQQSYAPAAVEPHGELEERPLSDNNNHYRGQSEQLLLQAVVIMKFFYFLLYDVTIEMS